MIDDLTITLDTKNTLKSDCNGTLLGDKILVTFSDVEDKAMFLDIVNELNAQTDYEMQLYVLSSMMCAGVRIDVK